MAIFRELETAEISTVAGGQSIRQLIEEAFPGGVWVGNSYYPNGVPGPLPLP